MDHADFLQHVDRFSELSGAVQNAGELHADAIHLIGRMVENSGTISAPDGVVVMTAGETVLIGRPSSGVYVVLDGRGGAPSSEPGLQNSGTINAGLEGSVSLIAGDIYSLAFHQTEEGAIRAGDIHIEGKDSGVVEVEGRLDVSDTRQGESGGSVRVLGDRVLVRGATIDASGDAGGGEILIGGDYQGKGETRTAARTFVTGDAKLRASAITVGDGGKVIVWADEATSFFGSVTARGGANGGDGGFVETSGREFLSITGAVVDAGALSGELGTWLLDPTDIRVVSDAAPDTTQLADVDAFGDADLGAGQTTIGVSAINNAGANVVLQANNDVFFDVAVNMTTVGVGLTAQAGNDITVDAPLTTNAGQISFSANDLGGTQTGSGAININAAIDGGGGTITMTTNAGTGTINLGANVTSSGGGAGITFSSDVVLTNGPITIETGNNFVRFDGPVDGAQALVVNAAGFSTTRFNAAVGSVTPLASLTTNAGGTVRISAPISTSGGMTFQGPVVLVTDSTLTDTGVFGITFADTVNGQNRGGQALTLNVAGATTFSGVVGGTRSLASIDTDAAGTTAINGGAVTTTGSQTYNDAVSLGAGTQTLAASALTFGSTLDGLGGLDADVAGTTTFSGVVGGTTSLASIDTDAAGTTVINASVRTSGGTMTFNDPVSLTGATTLTDTSGTGVTFNNTVDGAQDLTLAVTGTTSFNAAVGGNTPIGDGTGAALTINSNGTTTFASTLATASGITQADAAGTLTFRDSVTIATGNTSTTFNANVVLDGLTFTGEGALSFGNAATDQVTLSSGPVTIATSNDDVTFQAEVDGAQDLVVNAGTGTTSFNAAVGGTTPLGDGVGAAMTINSAGTTEFASTLATASGITQADTAGAVTFRDNVTIAAGNTATTLNANVVLDGLTLDVEGAVTFGNAGTDQLTVSGALVTVDTDSAGLGAGALVDVNAATSLNSDLTVSAGAAGITLDGTVDGNSALALNTTGMTDLNGVIGGTTPIASLVTDAGGTTELAANISTQGGTLTFSDDVVVAEGSSVTLNTTAGGNATGAAVDLQRSLDGTALGVVETLAVNAGTAGAVTINSVTGTVGTADPLNLTVTNSGSTTVSGAANVVAMTLTDTTGAITFDDNLTATTLTTTAAGYSVVLHGTATTVTNAATFANTGGVSLGDAAGDTLTFNGGLTSTASTTSTAGTIATSDDLINLGAVTLTGATTLAAGSGDITLGAIDGNSALALNTTGTTDLNGVIGGNTPVASLVTNVGGTTELGANVTAQGGTITFNDPVTLTAGVTLTDTGGTGLSFADTLNGARDLTLAVTGTTTFRGAVGGTTPLGDGTGAALTINSSGTSEFQSTLAMASGITQADAAGTLAFRDNVTLTAGDTATTLSANVVLDGLTFTGNGALGFGNTATDQLTLSGGSVTIATSDDAVTFAARVDGGQDLTLNAGAGATSFSAAVGGTMPLGDGTGAALTINSTGTTEFLSTLATASGITQAGAAGAVTFRENVTIAAGDTPSMLNANVVLDGLLTLDAEDAVTFGDDPADTLTVSSGAVTVDTASANTSAGALVDVNAATTLNLNSDLTITTSAAGITLDGAVDGNSALALNTTGTTDLNGVIGGTTPVASLVTNVGGTTELGANVIAQGGTITFNDPVTLTAGVTLTDTGGTGLSFADTLNGAQDLTLAVTGTTTFSGAVGGTTPLGDGTGAALTINSTGTTEFQSTLATASGITQADTAGTLTFRDHVTLAAGDTATTLNANVVRDGLTFTGNGTLGFGNAATDQLTLSGGSVTIATSDDAVTFAARVDGGQDLTLNAGAGATSFNAAVGNTTPLGDGTGAALTINSTGTTAFQSTLATDSGITQADTAGTLTFRDNVTLAAGDTATTFKADVVLDGLMLDAERAVTFGNTGTDQLRVSGVLVRVDTASSGGGVGAVVDVNAATTLNADLTVSTAGAVIRLDGAVDGNSVLALNTTGTTDLNGVIGGTTPIASLTTNAGGTTELGANLSAQDGTLTFNDPVSLTAGVTLTDTGGTGLSFADTLDGAQNLVLAITGPTTFAGAVGATTPLGTGTGAALTINSTGTTEFQATLVTASGITQAATAGALTFRDDVSISAGDTASTFNADVTLDGLTFTANGGVTFGNTSGDQVTLSTGPVTVATSDDDVTFRAEVVGAQVLTVNAGTGTTRFDAVLGGATPLLSVTTDAGGRTEIGASITTSGGTQTYNDPVDLTGTITLTDIGMIGITFNDTLDGAQDLTLEVTNAASFNAAVGATTPLGDGVGAAITINSVGTTTFGSTLATASGILQADGADALTFQGTTMLGAGDTPTTLMGNVTLDGLTFTADGGVTFGNASTDQVTLSTGAVAVATTDDDVTFEAQVDGAQALTVNAGTGTTRFYAVVGGTTPLLSVTTDAGGRTEIGASVTTSGGTQTYNDAVDLTGPNTLTDMAGTGVIFNSSVDGAQDLTLNVTSATSFNGTVGATTPIGDGVGPAITIDSAGTTTFGSTLATASGITQADATGALAFQGDVTLGAGDTPTTLLGNVILDGLTFSANGDVTFGSASSDQVTLSGGPVTVATSGADVTFQAEVDGAQVLIVNAGTGTTRFNAAVGDATPLLSVTTDAGGRTEIGTSITTSGGTQTYNDPVDLTGPSTLTDIGTTGIIFNNTLDGARDLILNVENASNFNGAVGATTPLGDGVGPAIVINSTGTTTFGSTLATASGILQANGAEVIIFRGDVTAGVGDTPTTLLAGC